MSVEEQVIIIYTVVNGHLDDLPVSNLGRFEEEYLEFLDANYPEIGEEIAEIEKLSDELKAKLDEKVKEFKDMFQVKKQSIVDMEDEKAEDTEAEEAEVK
jgi:F-type H+-transporting ATPase subunit alpha